MAAAPVELAPLMDGDKCGALNRQGKRCGNPAGKGTEHLGVARCSAHGGNTPSGKLYAAKMLALREAAMSPAEIDTNPLDAMLYAVRRGSKMATSHRLMAETAWLGGENPYPYEAMEQKALDYLVRWSKMATDAGVAERMVRIAEGTGERLASALEEALEGVELPPGQRQVVVQRFAASLSRLEREQPAITAKASDA